MRILVISVALLLAHPTCAAELGPLLCTHVGIGGISFGDAVEGYASERISDLLDDQSIHVIEAPEDISPFTRVIVRLTPTSQQIYTATLEMVGSENDVDSVIDELKTGLSERYPDLGWTVRNSFGDADQVPGIQASLEKQVVLESEAGTHRLVYDCTSNVHIRISVLELFGLDQ